MKKRFALVLLFAVAAAFTGCVERALVITSEPSGADVTVNQQWKGKTPYVVPFKHYGVYDIWIEHPGIEENGKVVKFYPLHVGEPIKAPGYQYAGVDLVTEVLLPTTLRDQHNLHYVLERVDKADDVSDVLARAQQLREASQRRTDMRLEKDAGRRRSGPEPVVVPSAGTPAPVQADGGYVPADGYYMEQYPAADFDATPPMPSEMPLFLP